MPETKRLNKPFHCIFCQVDVNPYIIEHRSNHLVVECPNCRSTSQLVKTPGEDE